MRIIFFNRKPGLGHFSLERLFREMPKYLPAGIDFKIYTCTYLSKGIFPRLYSIYEAWKRQEKNTVNHITGDVHFISLLLSKKRTVLTIHDCNFINRSRGLKRYLLQFFWMTLPLKKVNYITVVSRATKDEVLKHTNFPEDRIVVIPNFVSPDFVPVFKKFNTPKPTILQIGTGDNKNILRLLTALKGLPIHLTIIGYQTTEIILLLKKYKIEHSWYHGLSDEEIRQKYIDTDLLSFVSTEEGFGLPIIEAQTVGRPVITSKLSSLPEVGGDGVCYVNPLDIMSIRSGILKVINDSEYREKIIQAGFKNVKRFQVKNIANAYVEVYKKCLKSNSV